MILRAWVYVGHIALLIKRAKAQSFCASAITCPTFAPFPDLTPTSGNSVTSRRDSSVPSRVSSMFDDGRSTDDRRHRLLLDTIHSVTPDSFDPSLFGL